jgi:hypothetical protein
MSVPGRLRYSNPAPEMSVEGGSDITATITKPTRLAPNGHAGAG